MCTSNIAFAAFTKTLLANRLNIVWLVSLSFATRYFTFLEIEPKSAVKRRSERCLHRIIPYNLRYTHSIWRRHASNIYLFASWQLVPKRTKKITSAKSPTTKATKGLHCQKHGFNKQERMLLHLCLGSRTCRSFVIRCWQMPGYQEILQVPSTTHWRSIT